MEIEAAALDEIVARTEGYPYFLQEWGKHAWNEAEQSPITLSDVRAASDRAVAELDQSFFRVRFDRLTPTEYQYLRGMAELGPGPHRFARHRRDAGARAALRRPDPQPPHRQGNDLEPGLRRYRLHRAPVR